MTDEVVIDESNFSQYFRDCRISRPERGDVMARYCAVAEFVDGQMKQDIIDLLLNKDKAFAATQVMRKLGCANQKDAIKICRQVAEDLASGMTPEEVEKKVYEYELEVFYYTKKEYVPLDDPHWSIISIANLDTFLDASNQKITMKAKHIIPEGAEVAYDVAEAAETNESQV
jgi:hypothetical protein